MNQCAQAGEDAMAMATTARQIAAALIGLGTAAAVERGHWVPPEKATH